MKTLEIVVKNVIKAREIAENVGVEIVSEKLITVCTLMVLKGNFDALMDFNDETFFESNRPLYNEYLKELIK